MAFVPVPECVQVEFRWTCEGSKCENRVYVAMGEAPNNTNMAALGAAMTTWVNDHYLPMLSVNIVITEILITDASLQEGAQITIPINLPGGQSGEQYANEVSFCVSLRTGSRGRSKRGRWFMPPPLLSDRSGPNNASSAYATAAQQLLQALINETVTAGFNVCVASFQVDGVKLSEAITTNYLAAVLVDTLWDSQRNRKPGNGS